MKPKYYETGRVEDLHLMRSPETVSPIEGTVSLALKERAKGTGLSLECFLGRHAELMKWWEVKKGESVLVRLVLLNWQYNNTRPALLKKKIIKHLDKYEYKVKGEILELESHPE
mgnify:FL=1